MVHALHAEYRGASLWLETRAGAVHRVPLLPTAGTWQSSSVRLAPSDDDAIIRIGVDMAAASDVTASLNLGELVVRRGGEP